MGTDKALLTIGGVTLLERALHLLEDLALTPRIVATRPDLEAYAPVVPDRRSGCGPLSGIESGLLASNTDLAIFIPVDLPLMSTRIVQRLIQRALRTGALASIPRVLGQVQPLCAIYHRALLPAISRSLTEGDYKVMRVVQQAAASLSQCVDLFDLETVIAAEGQCDNVLNAAGRAFFNCNSPTDFSRIESFRPMHPSACEQAISK